MFLSQTQNEGIPKQSKRKIAFNAQMKISLFRTDLSPITGACELEEVLSVGVPFRTANPR